VVYPVAPFPEKPGKDVMGYIGPEVPDMGIVIHRGAATVKTGFPWFDAFKLFYPTTQRIV
jgi:hypothetical protein